MMNRKNTILIAVMINAGLVAVLLIAALTTQEEVAPATTLIGDAASPMPKFDDTPLFNPERNMQSGALPVPVELAALNLAEIPVVATEEALVHKLPPLASGELAAPAPSLPKLEAPAPVVAMPSLNEVTVKKGDSLEKIAKANKTTVDEIIKINHLPSSFLKIGQVLKIPTERSLASAPKTAKPVEKKTLEMGPEYYTMKVGDNPWAIAMKHHMKVEELLRLNGLNEERARKLKPGDRLRIR